MTDHEGAGSEARTSATAAALRGYLDALTSGDVPRIAASFAPDATWWLHGDLPMAGTRRGRDAIMQFLLGAGELFVPGSQSFEFGDITAQGERAVLEWRVTGRATATGLAYDNSYAGVFVIRDGLIVEIREYLDTRHAGNVLYR